MIVPVSVVIPCFRSGTTIKRAIESVVSQTRRPAEVIVVDDHSDDGTVEILESLAEAYGPGLRIIRHSTNLGPAAARNTGWDAATQPFVAFLDADDAWHPRKLEIQYDWMSKRDDVVLTGHRWVVLSETAVELSLPDEFKTTPITFGRLLIRNQLSTPTVMLRREIPYRFEPSKRYSEDYLLWLELACDGHAMWRLELPLAFGFKSAYGAGGLSGDLWRMELGELDTIRRLQQSARISRGMALLAMSWSLGKFAKRVVHTAVRNALTRVGSLGSSLDNPHQSDALQGRRGNR